MLLAAVMLATAAGPANAAPAEPELQRLLDARRDRGSSEWVVRQLEARRAQGHDDAATVAALLRARYFLATAWLRREDEDAAERVLTRAVDDGVRWLAAHAGRRWPDYDALDGAWSQIDAASRGVFYWTTLSYGAAIPYRSIFSRMGAAKRFRRGLERLVALDRDFFHGGPDRVLAEFLHKAPGIAGGDDDRAKEHARRALAQHPRYIENTIVHAIVVLRPERGDAAYRAALHKALQMPVDALPDCVPEQRAARRRAQRLLEELD
ncbi:MAG: hypothetical protein D6776_04105 [Planctomycetota bacterium]|nr:MAG: hypothetical protein D6776_04105 [Planctomycetota bacterium]